MSTGGGQGGSAYPKSIQAGIPKIDNPAGWPTPKIGALLKVVQRPVRLEKTKEYRLVTARRSRGGIVRRETLLGKDIATPSQFEIAEGDFLISRRQIAHGACGIVPSELAGSIVSNEYATLRPTSALDPGFLKHLTASIYFQQTCFHSSIGVHVEKLVFDLQGWLRWPIAVPEPPEQRRIAAVLDTWDEAILLAEGLVTAKEKQRRGLTVDYASSSSSELVTLGSIGRFVKGRGLPKSDLTPTGVPCLRYAEIYTQYRDTTRTLISRTSKAGAQSSKPLRYGDIVFAASGETAEEIGKALAYLAHDEAVVGSDTVVLTGHGQNAAYLAHILNSEPIAKQKAAAGKGHSVVHIHAPDLAKLLVPLPSLTEQNKVAAALEAIEEQIGLNLAIVSHLRTQKRGLMQRLLTGQLRVSERIDALLPGPNEVAA